MTTRPTVTMFPRITRDPKILHGVAMVRDTEVPVYLILIRLGEGRTWKQILEQYPRLEPADIREAALYAAAVLHMPLDAEHVMEGLAPALDAMARHDREGR